MNLRDHDHECIHGWQNSHWIDKGDGTPNLDLPLCPGGQIVTADDIQEMAHALWQAEQMDEYWGTVL